MNKPNENEQLEELIKQDPLEFAPDEAEIEEMARRYAAVPPPPIDESTLPF